jgi:hypothetical protein
MRLDLALLDPDSDLGMRTRIQIKTKADFYTLACVASHAVGQCRSAVDDRCARICRDNFQHDY